MKRGGERGGRGTRTKKRENLPGGNKPSIRKEEEPSLHSTYIIISAAILSTAKNDNSMRIAPSSRGRGETLEKGLGI